MGGLEGKYRVAAPELMQDTFMSDSEDEGGEVECPIQQQQQYRYMNSEVGTLHRAKPLEDTVTDGHLWPSNNDKKVATMERQPVDIGFLVSFVVDARGGAMKAKRRGGVRIIVPPAACAAPTRVTCRAATRRAPAAAPPPLMEGEALASRLLELQPAGAKFLAPVIIEVPIFTSACRDREIVILRSDTGETWQDHYLHNNDNPMIQEALERERQEYGNNGEALGERGERVTRIVTCDFPHYLACVSRVRQEVHVVGPEGGTVSSSHIPQVQALFPPAALTKRIRVGVQAQGADAAQRARVLPRRGAVSAVVTVEPRRRKFHRAITLTVPLPQPQDGHEKPSTSNLRLLCSIMGGQARAVWEDVTGSTPLTITDDCASFTTTVSARFWLMNCQNVNDATKLATDLYREMLLVPFDVRIVVLGKRLDPLEGRLLVMTITDRYAYETLLQQEHYTEVAHSTSVRLLDGKEVYLEFSGNLVPVTKSGTQPMLTFEAFKDNRAEFTVRVKHREENPSGRIYFMNEPKVPKGEQSQAPACVLDVELPERVAPRAKSQLDYLNLDQSGFDALKDELSFHWGEHNHSTGPGSSPCARDKQLNGHDLIITNGNIKYTKDEDIIDPKPQLNGGTLHVDSNKVKATFDSDEDKTPQNTLEKGKKKPETSFLGGLADKVKNVFSHSEEKDDEDKESSPKPQPKPREPKDKSPPKPAPRIINEELLGKVDDMFKDLQKKPQQKDDEDLTDHVYTTKLVVDEDEKPPLQDIQEDLYEQYANMQPVDTPVQYKKTDPFQFYVGCCEGRFKKGQKHRHDETSNVVDRIEQVNFAKHEINNELAEGLDKLEKEQDNIKQKVGDAVNDQIGKLDHIKDNLEQKGEELKTSAQDKIEEVEDSAKNKLHQVTDAGNKIKDDISTKVTDVKDNLVEEAKDAKEAAKNAINSFTLPAGIVKDKAKMKELAIDFLAREQAEEHRVREMEIAKEAEKKLKEASNDLIHKKNEAESDIKIEVKKTAAAVVDTVHDLQDDLCNKAIDTKENVKETVEKVKDATKGKLQSLGDSFEGAKEKGKKATEDLKADAKAAKEDIKKEGKKKSKQGKNFFTGLVHNIFGEKEKIEDEIKGKISEGKDSANDLLNQATAKKDELSEDIAKKQHEVTEDAKSVVKGAQDKTAEAAKALKDTKDSVEKSLHDETDKAKKAAEEAIRETESTVKDKTNEIQTVVVDKTKETKNAIQDKVTKTKDAVNNKTEQIKGAIDDAKDAAFAKASEAKSAIDDKANETINTIEHKTNDVKSAAADKADELKETAQSIAADAKDAAHGAMRQIQDGANSAKTSIEDRTSEIKGAVESKVNEIHNKGSELTDAVCEKTSDIKNTAVAKSVAFKDTVYDAAGEVKEAVHDKAGDIKNTIQEKANESILAVKDTTQAVGTAVVNKKDEIQQGIRDQANKATGATQSELDQIRREAEKTTDEIKKSAEDTLNAAANKRAEFQTNVRRQVNDISDAGRDELENLQQSSKQALGRVQDSALSTFDKVESSTKDKMNEATDTWENLQSSTRDTFADIRDSVGSSTQDTLRSFQSSAGDTFDSLDDSVKEVFGGAQSAASNVRQGSEELFGNVKESFEGFQVSADNKLEDVKGLAKNRLEEAGERLGEVGEEVKGDVKQTEQAVADSLTKEADSFTSSLNNLGNSVFGSSGKGFMKDSSTKLLESEKAQSSQHKKSSGIPKLKRKK